MSDPFHGYRFDAAPPIQLKHERDLTEPLHAIRTDDGEYYSVLGYRKPFWSKPTMLLGPLKGPVYVL